MSTSQLLDVPLPFDLVEPFPQIETLDELPSYFGVIRIRVLVPDPSQSDSTRIFEQSGACEEFLFG